MDIKTVISIVDIVIAIILTVLFCIFFDYDKTYSEADKYWLSMPIALFITALIVPALLYLLR